MVSLSLVYLHHRLWRTVTCKQFVSLPRVLEETDELSDVYTRDDIDFLADLLGESLEIEGSLEDIAGWLEGRLS